MPGRIKQRWVETPNGFVWGGNVQPVCNQPNTIVIILPTTSLGQGMGVEVTVPYLDLILENPPSRAPWFHYRESIGLPARLVYSQIAWWIKSAPMNLVRSGIDSTKNMAQVIYSGDKPKLFVR